MCARRWGLKLADLRLFLERKSEFSSNDSTLPDYCARLLMALPQDYLPPPPNVPSDAQGRVSRRATTYYFQIGVG